MWLIYYDFAQSCYLFHRASAVEVDNHRLDIFFTFDTEWLIANFEMVPNISFYIWYGLGIFTKFQCLKVRLGVKAWKVNSLFIYFAYSYKHIKKQIFIRENERLKRAKKGGIVYESFPNDLKISTLGFLFKSGNENRQFFLSLIVHICPTKYFSFWKKTRCFMHIFQCVGNTL